MGADFFMSVNSMIERLGANPVPVQIPIGAEDEFRGPIDLVGMKAIYFDDETLGAKYTEGDIPDRIMPDRPVNTGRRCSRHWLMLMTTIMEKFLRGEEIQC